MRTALVVAIVILSAVPALAQTAQPGQGAPLVPSPFQALGNIIRNPDAPPPPPPQTGTSRPLALPTAIPPNTIGTNLSGSGR